MEENTPRFSRTLAIWLVVVAVLPVLLRPAQAQLADTPWPKKHHDLRNTGQSPNAGPSTASLKWKTKFSSKVQTSPTIGLDGTIYLGATFAPLFAIDPETGEKKWNTTGGGDADISSPTIALDGTIYMGDRGNTLWAVRPVPDGLGNLFTVDWRHKIRRDGDIKASPTLDPADGTIYVTCLCNTGDDSVFAFNPDPPTAEGEVDWQFKTDDNIGRIVPAINDLVGHAHERTIYVGGLKQLYALLPDGTLKWKSEKLKGGRNRGASAVIGPDGTIYIASRKRLFAFRDDGNAATKLWETGVKGKIDSTPALSATGMLYIGTSKGFFYGIQAATGNIEWQEAGFDKPIISSPAVDVNGIIYAPSGKTLYALNPGVNPGQRILWQFKTGGNINKSAPAISDDGGLYFGSGDKHLYAFQDPLP